MLVLVTIVLALAVGLILFGVIAFVVTLISCLGALPFLVILLPLGLLGGSIYGIYAAAVSG